MIQIFLTSRNWPKYLKTPRLSHIHITCTFFIKRINKNSKLLPRFKLDTGNTSFIADNTGAIIQKKWVQQLDKIWTLSGNWLSNGGTVGGSKFCSILFLRKTINPQDLNKIWCDLVSVSPPQGSCYVTWCSTTTSVNVLRVSWNRTHKYN